MILPPFELGTRLTPDRSLHLSMQNFSANVGSQRRKSRSKVLKGELKERWSCSKLETSVLPSGKLT